MRGFVETGNYRYAPTWPVCLQIKNSSIHAARMQVGFED
jgi:hypothetical protein